MYNKPLEILTWLKWEEKKTANNYDWPQNASNFTVCMLYRYPYCGKRRTRAMFAKWKNITYRLLLCDNVNYVIYCKYSVGVIWCTSTQPLRIELNRMYIVHLHVYTHICNCKKTTVACPTYYYALLENTFYTNAIRRTWAAVCAWVCVSVPHVVQTKKAMKTLRMRISFTYK